MGPKNFLIDWTFGKNIDCEETSGRVFGREGIGTNV